MDGLPKDYEMIYKFPLHYTLNTGKMVGVATSTIIPLAWLNNYIKQVPENQVEFISSLSTNVSDLWWFAGALALTNFIVYRCCHVATLRVYRNQKE